MSCLLREMTFHMRGQRQEEIAGLYVSITFADRRKLAGAPIEETYHDEPADPKKDQVAPFFQISREEKT